MSCWNNSNNNGAVSAQQVERWILQSNDPSNPSQQYSATLSLQQWTSNNNSSADASSSALVPSTLFQLLQQSNHVTVQFYVLTALGQQQKSLTPDQRRALRQRLLTRPPTLQAEASFLRTKVASVLALQLMQDPTWTRAEMEPDLLQLAAVHPALLLTVLTFVLDDFHTVSEAASASESTDPQQRQQQQFSSLSSSYSSNNSARSVAASSHTTTVEQTRRFKDILKGYDQQQQQSATTTATLLERLFGAVVHIFSTSLQQQQQNAYKNNNDQQLPLLALRCITAFFQWTEVSFLGNNNIQPCLELLLWSVQATPSSSSNNNGNTTALCKAALQAWKAWVTSCSTNSPGQGSDNNSTVLNSSIQSVHDPKLPVLTKLLDRIHETGLLPYPSQQSSSSEDNASTVSIDAETMEVIIEVAAVVDATGQEVLPLYEQTVLSKRTDHERHTAVQALFHQVLDLFFRAFAYDDIDVATAVLPLAARLVSFMHEEKEETATTKTNQTNGATTNRASSGLRQHLPLFLNTLYNQMKYPADFGYDYEDDDDAEEQVFRTELDKVYQKLVRVAPTTCLQFLCEAAASHGDSMAAAPTPAVEATLRLIYHYCEGVRPPPGLRVVLKNETFCSLLVALHTSNIARHPHREVVCLYYETAVRYAPLFVQKQHTHLLSALLGSMTGASGLQHPVARVRSRCCYLLLGLVKATASLLRPFVETAVSGIQGLLSNGRLELRPDDTLYLFETIGLLLGKTGLSAPDQQRYLTAVMTPHVRSMEQVVLALTSRNTSTTAPGAQPRDVDQCGQILSGSIAALAHLSKGFSNKPVDEVKVVLAETLNITVTVLEALPSSEQVRNKSMVLLQRMIACVGPGVLPVAPKFLRILVAHCDNDDILSVSQVINQLCIKFKNKAMPVIDTSLLLFLQKCNSLALAQEEAATGSNHIPPHLRTEQLQIQKLAFTVLQHVVCYEATLVLISPTNASSFEMILKTMSDGAVLVNDPVIRKTCVRFFRELISQWTAPVTVNDGVDNVYRSGLLTFFCQSFVPDVFASMMHPDFDSRDANQARVVTEYAQALSVIKFNSETAEMYQQCVGTMQSRVPFPPELQEAFGRASNASEIEACLQQILKAKHSNRNGV